MVYEVDSGETTSMCTKDFVPWLSESPITGTITAAGVQNVVVTFDAGVPEVAQPGVYNAQLMIVNDTPYVVANIPITMTVVTATYGVTISPDDSKTGYPGEVVVYEVVITNTSNGPTDSFTMTLGTSAWTTNLDTPVVGPLDPGESATVHVSVIVPLDAAPPDQDTVHVTVTSVGDPTKSAVAVLTTSVTMTNIYLPLIWKVSP
jgi:uncharacterized membrane protein